jgi:hypothetical protein
MEEINGSLGAMGGECAHEWRRQRRQRQLSVERVHVKLTKKNLTNSHT